jgi:hypothetical protein
MSEVTDIVLPILQRIQSDVAELKRDLSDTKRDLAGKMDVLTERMEEFEGFFTYSMGLTSQHKLAITRLHSEVCPP